MSIIEEVTDRHLGLPIGLGLAIAAISVGPKLVSAGRPLIKGAMKGYLMLQAKSKELLAETSERMQDLYAEAKHEYDQSTEMRKAERAQPASAEESAAKAARKPKPTTEAE
jgi:hypothetical protein